MELFIRTEDIPEEDLFRYFVETKVDREIIDALKSRNPTIIVGSRGVGKSFLLRIAEQELKSKFQESRIFPVYLSFTRGSLIQSDDPLKFQHWMLALICSRIIRALSNAGLLMDEPKGASVLAGSRLSETSAEESPIGQIGKKFEDSWKDKSMQIDTSILPTIDEFKDAIQDLCKSLNISRISLLIDEAAHILLPTQQRDFFTLFRDLRSPYLTLNAAVYPGVTVYGDTFQPTHDAAMIHYDRNISDLAYLSKMREIVEKQIDDSSILTDIEKNGKNFSIMAFASSGNPRILLKTLQKMPDLKSKEVNTLIREYYKDDVWAEHSSLAIKYSGYRPLVDWGRRFIEENVLPDLKKKNDSYMLSDKATTCFFWIHRDAPQLVREALRLLEYTGVVTEDSSGLVATRGTIGTRYRVNLGCLFSLEPTPTSSAFEIAKNLTPKRMTEFGANHPAFSPLNDTQAMIPEPDSNQLILEQLDKSIETLDLTRYQIGVLKEVGIHKIRDILDAKESKLMEAKYIGEKKSRRIKNTAITSVMEFLSG